MMIPTDGAALSMFLPCIAHAKKGAYYMNKGRLRKVFKIYQSFQYIILVCADSER
jgi:hypothetical protein